MSNNIIKKKRKEKIMKKIIANIKKALEDLGKHYLDAMTWYGDAINNSRGLVGA